MFRELIVTMLLVVLAAIACGVPLGVFFRVYVLFFASAIILCVGAECAVAYGDLWLIVPTLASVVSVQMGYVIGAVVMDGVQRTDQSGSPPLARV